jgi:hypothetical protein
MQNKKHNLETTIEKFEGIRKNNSKKIFGILMIILIINSIYDIMF